MHRELSSSDAENPQTADSSRSYKINVFQSTHTFLEMHITPCLSRRSEQIHILISKSKAKGKDKLRWE